jgi:hypothetical protein
VAWLEALAAQGLDDEAALSAAGGGTAGRFGAREGVWAETRLRLAAGIARSGEQPLVRVVQWPAVSHRVGALLAMQVFRGDCVQGGGGR